MHGTLFVYVGLRCKGALPRAGFLIQKAHLPV